MPRRVFLTIIITVILAAGLTVAIASSLSVPLWGLGLAALLGAAALRYWGQRHR